MKRILVIGAKGMLGRDLSEILRSSLGTDVIGWDIDELDIREEKETVEKIGKLRPEIVVNLAAYTRVDDCEFELEKAFAINAEGMRNVALGASNCGARVVYLSTDYVFDGKKETPYLEEDPPHPLSVYGRSKLQGEKYVQDLTENGLIVRTQWLFGKYGNNFITAVLRQAQEKETLSIVDDQIGSPTYTIDLSKVISVLIQRNARGIFHVSNSDVCSWYTFGQAILDQMGIVGVKVVPISSKELNRQAPRPPYSVFNCQKMSRETGMTMRSWFEAMKDYLQSLEGG